MMLHGLPVEFLTRTLFYIRRVQFEIYYVVIESVEVRGFDSRYRSGLCGSPRCDPSRRGKFERDRP